MTEEFKNVEDLSLKHLGKFTRLRPFSALFHESKDFNVFFDAYMGEFKFEIDQFVAMRNLDHKYDKQRIKLADESKQIEFDLETKKEKYLNKRQKKLNRERFKIFKKECKLAHEQGLEYEKNFFEQKQAEFKARREAEQQQKKEEKEQEKQDKKNAKENAKQGIVVKKVKVKPAKIEGKEEPKRLEGGDK